MTRAPDRFAGPQFDRRLLDVLRHADAGGYTMRCALCDAVTSVTADDLEAYLVDGWPKHCGATMRLESGRATPAGRTDG